jgi:antitoxin (DNA-binding transcriptional repressor) of toxin-antitoxin stability system
MQTLTPNKARANLSALLRQALNGEEIGIVCGDRIVALRPVEVTASDYARMEYDITDDEMRSIARKLHARAT